MKTNFLFPKKFRIIGWILLISGVVLGCMMMFSSHGFEFDFLNITVLSLFDSSFAKPSINNSRLWTLGHDNFTNELAGILTIVGGIFVAFSKFKSNEE